jgi:hypothetical protein
MAKKRRFDPPIIGVETVQGTPVFYNKSGDYSVLIECENPVLQYSADIDLYYDFHALFTNVLKILGSGHTIQKHDVFCKRKFQSPKTEDYLSQCYFSHFEGRETPTVLTYLIITGEINKSKFFSFDSKKFDAFIRNVTKILDLFQNKGLRARLMNENEIRNYIRRFFTLNFNKKIVTLDNFNVKDEYLKVGKKNVKNLSIVDIDEVNFPSYIRPCKEVNIGLRFPVDLMSFLIDVPNVDTLVYSQTIIIPDQQNAVRDLEAKRKRHSGMPDPANGLCVEDIDKVMTDIAKDGQLLIYTNYNIIMASKGDISELDKAINFVESSLFDSSIIPSKQCSNQMELFECSMPGNAPNFPQYDKFLTTSDTGLCLLFKERMQTTEESPFLTYFTDRKGQPIGIDISGKEGDVKLTNNANFFVLGPSGSGKSFYVNSKVRQWVLANTDIVLVDTGHSYSGLCDYYGGRYITYTDEKPITMNPFRIKQEEYNIEKKNFLKSLIFLIWKGTNGVIEKEEEELIEQVLDMYYNFHFNPFPGYSEDEKAVMRNTLILSYESSAKYRQDEEETISEREVLKEKLEKLHNLAERGEGGEKANAQMALDNMLSQNSALLELSSPRDRMLEIIEKQIQRRENRLKKIKVESLSFNTFYEFSLQIIPIICEEEEVSFDLAKYKFILKKFYKGGQLEKTLNDEFETSLFDERFIVFEIDAIKEDPLLFPIVTLIIVDVFIQKMRLKKNRKALIIEEAWKAIASPMMAGYILYLYKTVRKFWGMAMVVTQELEDIIGNAVVKNSIVNNSDIICLLDQTKFKDNYEEIAQLLALSDVEKKKIFTINQLQNREGRNRFNEVYIKRGAKGQVFGVEVSLHEYFTFTTERIEKDTVSYYQAIYGNFQEALDCFISDLKKSKLKQGEWVRQASTVLGYYQKQGQLNDLFNSEAIIRDSLCDFIKTKYKELTNK